MKLSIIAAVDQNNAIGKGNTLPWKLPADLANFKALTTGKLIIMGRKTWESLGCRPLPDRKTLVITRNANEMEVPDGVLLAKSIPEAMKFVTNAVNDEAFPEEVFIVGGAEIYHQFMPHADKIYLSRIDLKVEDADAHFPEIDRNVWQMNYHTRNLKDGLKHTLDWHYQIWGKTGV
ncbi:hypothetical protein pEaSNUABM9_00016 [Erwinia phage pEa_SNUABM_9]|nr:hypothetical protein pEaSNUABM9_00016 [Erwinia phage pEa_SNUABM_9]